MVSPDSPPSVSIDCTTSAPTTIVSPLSSPLAVLEAAAYSFPSCTMTWALVGLGLLPLIGVPQLRGGVAPVVLGIVGQSITYHKRCKLNVPGSLGLVVLTVQNITGKLCIFYDLGNSFMTDLLLFFL